MTVTSMIPNDTPFLPPKVTEVPKETLRNFPHTKKVGNYLLGNTLGEGSFAKVKEALHIPTGERVAVKIIDKKKSREDSYVRKNLRREGKILQMVRHPHVVHLLEIMETQNSYYLVTELCRGGDLMDYISQRRKLTEQEVKKYIRQIVSAVDYLHRLGILHRDLKIENLLLDEHRDMKIIDFGLSNSVKVVQTKDGPKAQEYCVTQCGSPAYAAPELLGRRKYGPQVDIWSIGVNMYAMLTGNLPFTVEPFNIKTLHSKMVNGQMNPLPDGISRDCRDIIQKFLNPDPDRRITIEELLRHPWIADGSGNPMSRAPCPNKLKTEAMDNSILKHMSENQGFRVGEIIRYVTGNVPSSATAMYNLMLRKLTKHYGNLRATGKIAANHRMLNRTQNITTSQMKSRANTFIVSKQDSESEPVSNTHQQQHGVTNHTVNVTNHTVNMARSAMNAQHRTKEAALVVPASEKDQDNTSDVVDKPFTDLSKTKQSNGVVHTPRVLSPGKQRRDQNNATPHLPNVANKYIKRTLTVKQLYETEETAILAKPNTNKLSENSNEEPFRKRASTFPGKVQQHSEEEKGQENCHEHTTSDNCEKVEYRIVTRKVRTEREWERAGTSPVRNNDPPNTPGSPRCRKDSAYQHNVTQTIPHPASPTSRTNQVLYQSRRQSHIPRRIVDMSLNKTHVRKSNYYTPREQSFEEETDISKHILLRPSRNNKLLRMKLDANRDDLVVEQVAEVSSSSTRPLSSRNTVSGTSSNRPGTPIFPTVIEHVKQI